MSSLGSNYSRGDRLGERRARSGGGSTRTTERVRFSTPVRDQNRTNTTLTDAERTKRKRDALDFLRRERSQPAESTLESVLARNREKRSSTDPLNRKTYELLKERPIAKISDRTRRTILRDDKNADSFAKKFHNEYASGIDENAKETNRPQSLLNSLSEFGSKLLGSILFNEKNVTEEPVPKERYKRPYDDSSSRYRQLPSMTPYANNTNHIDELDSTLKLQQAKLDKLNRELESKRMLSLNDPFYDNRYFQAKTDNIENKLQSILKEVNNDSNDKLLKELVSIKEELIGLKKKQESNNIKFESRFEDLKMEQQRNKRNFDRMISELDEKREILDLEKEKLMKLLKKRKVQKHKRRKITTSRNVSFSSSSSDDSEVNDNYSSTINSKATNDELMAKVEKLKKSISNME